MRPERVSDTVKPGQPPATPVLSLLFQSDAITLHFAGIVVFFAAFLGLYRERGELLQWSLASTALAILSYAISFLLRGIWAWTWRPG